MDFKIVNDLLIRSTDKTRFNKGNDYYQNGYVEEIKYTNEERTLNIEGKVLSESSSATYNSSIVLDLKDKNIDFVNCDCVDFIKRSKNEDIPICKHIVAVTLYVENLLKSDVISNLKQKTLVVKNKNKAKRSKNFINKDLLDSFNRKPKEKVNLDARVEFISEDNIRSYFKVGIDKMYVMKNIQEFSYSRLNSTNLVFGVDFVYNPLNNYFDYDDEKIVDMIEEYCINTSNILNNYEYKFMTSKGSNIRRLFESLQYKDFDFKFKNMYYKPKVIIGTLPIKFNLDLNEEGISLSTNESLPYPLSLQGDVLFYKGDIYILSHDNGFYYKKIYSVIQEFNEISFDKSDGSKVLTDIIPKLENICEYVKVDDSIIENTSKDLNIKFYFDLDENRVSCKLDFTYEGENEGKFVIRDKNREEEAIYRLYTNFFEKENDKYIFRGNDDQLYDFLSKDINRLKNLGEVYYSDKLKEKRIYTSSSIRVGLGEEFNHYLEFNFHFDGVDEDEYENIINSIKNKKKYYKLGNGNFINLEEEETKEIFKLMESLGFTDDLRNMKIHSSKSIYLNDLLTDKKLPYINGLENVQDIVNRFKKLDNLKVEVPKSLNASLRDYQISALSWFETIDYLGFGGILADEMGLGKTIQTITFLLTKENKKTIIITPTSLIHNWKSEFEHFAPTLKVGIAHGLKKDRMDIIKNIDEYDIILTSYGSIRNDIESYENINFDYCIIDEAQNIKNPMASTTDCVKRVKANIRFALTGTPIENNLLELWSIFDFIMPGYLYNLTKFNAVFIKDEGQIENLKRMIRPFILRRTKKQVIKELPDKIERRFLVEMNKSQRNVYGVYVEEIKQKLKENKEIKNKITIFSYLTKLRQLCLDPSVVIEGYRGKSSKIEACLEIINEYIEENNKILVFSQFTTVLKNIAKKLDKNNINYSYLDGSTKAEERIRLVNEFNESNEKSVFLISLKAGGTGLNLTSANTVIHFDPWWNPSVEKQASDRAHRYGQKQVVEVIKLISKGTIEEKIVELQDKKQNLIEDMIDGNLYETNILRNLTNEELLDLLK